VNATYSLTAIPWLMTDGHLKCVLFIATNGIETNKWSSTNGCTFVEYLKQLVAPDKGICQFAKERACLGSHPNVLTPASLSS
jgi:hypothetical protein